MHNLSWFWTYAVLLEIYSLSWNSDPNACHLKFLRISFFSYSLLTWLIHFSQGISTKKIIISKQRGESSWRQIWLSPGVFQNIFDFFLIFVKVHTSSYSMMLSYRKTSQLATWCPCPSNVELKKKFRVLKRTKRPW